MNREIEIANKGIKRGFARAVLSDSTGIRAVTPWRAEEIDAISDAERAARLLKAKPIELRQ